ncbi:MAG: hypothetical protein LBK61_01160, partial [Spirochaetaceae bacterium]|nr:hypothetical protein [Spirochaetaceae bacterium]
MKKTFKLLGVGIAVLTAIVFVLSGCDQLTDALDGDNQNAGEFVAVTDITGVPTGVVVDAAIDLSEVTVEPNTATNKTIVWTASGAGLLLGTVNGIVVTPTAAGTLTLTATIVNGAAEGLSFTKTFIVEVVDEDDFVAVTNITGVPETGTAGAVIDLSGDTVTVVPSTATNTTIVWSVAADSAVNADDVTITGTTVTSSEAGTLTLTATIANGATASTDYTKNFTIVVDNNFVAVTDITGVPTTGTLDEAIDLSAAVVAPETATNQTIVWTASGAGVTAGTVSGAAVTPTAAGTLTLTATIANGATTSTAFTKTFTVTVAGSSVPVTLNSVAAVDGAAEPFAPTSKITLTFSGDVTGLTADAIVIETEEDASFTKGTLTAKGSGVYELEVDALLETGPNAGIAVSVTAGDVAGYTISGDQTETLYAWVGIPDATTFAYIGTDEEFPVGGWYKQTDNITINSSWTPIAVAGDASLNTEEALSKCFSGVFDGGGFEIIPNITSSDNLSIFANAYEATFQNVRIGTGSMTVTANKLLGGIAGIAKKTSFINCSNAATLSGQGFIGGICGTLSAESIIDNCENTGDITSTANASSIGGICASISSTATIKNCSNGGSLTISGADTTATMHLGGIAGTALAASSVIKACYNTGDITGSAGKSNVMGGIVGRLGGIGSRVTACYNTG